MGKGQEITLTSNTHLLYQLSGHVQAAIVCEKSTVFTSPIEKPKLHSLTLRRNRSMPTTGHHLKSIISLSLMEISPLVPEKTF